MAKKTNWGLIILGVVIFAVIVGAGLIATFGFVMYRQLDIQTAAVESPEEEFKSARSRFEGQTPFIELPQDGATSPVVHREQIGAQPVPLTGLRVLAWDPQERKLVRFTIPFWLLRFTGGNNVRLSSREMSFDSDIRLNVSAADLERRGPGLILDYTAGKGERVLVWAE